MGVQSASVLAVLSLGIVACQQHRVGGLRAQDIFLRKPSAELAEAACSGKRSKILDLVKRGGSVNEIGVHKESILFWVISCQNLDGISELLTLGADPNYKGPKGMTPITIAATYEDSRILNVILSAGGNPNAMEDDGTSAIEMAFSTGIRTNRWGGYYMLLSAGARPVTRYNKQTMIFFAVFSERFDKAAELLDMGYRDKEISDLVKIHFESSLKSDMILEQQLQFLIAAKKTGVLLDKYKSRSASGFTSDAPTQIEKYAAKRGIQL